jgi:hypothetical protein
MATVNDILNAADDIQKRLLTGAAQIELVARNPADFGIPAKAATVWDKTKRLWTVYISPEFEDPEVIRAVLWHELGHVLLGHFQVDADEAAHHGRECMLIATDVHVNAAIGRERFEALKRAVHRPVDPVEYLEALKLDTPHYVAVHRAMHEQTGGSGASGNGEPGNDGGLLPDGLCGGIEPTDDPMASIAASIAASQYADAAGKQAAAGFGHGLTAGAATIDIPESRTPAWVKLTRRWLTAYRRFTLETADAINRPARVPRRYGVILPTRRLTWAPMRRHLVMVLDTSGSMQAEDLAQAIAAVKAIASRATPVRLIAGDTEVTLDVEITAAHAVPRTLTGSGGTDIKPLIDRAMQYRPDGLVLITDGYLDWPDDPGVPVLWIRTGAGNTPPWKSVTIVDAGGN